MTPPLSETEPHPEAPPRRTFLTTAAAWVAGGVAALVPVLLGAFAAIDPLRRIESRRGLILVARMAAIPDSGIPRRFTVTAERRDAWTTYRSTPVGAVYLRKTPDGVSALNVVCPHAGCFVGMAPDQTRFACPCHGSSFAFDGSINDPNSPSPRPMDELEVEVRNGDEVWVRFENFLPGREEKTRA